MLWEIASERRGGARLTMGRYLWIYCSIAAAYEFAARSNAVCKLLNETSAQDSIIENDFN